MTVFAMVLLTVTLVALAVAVVLRTVEVRRTSRRRQHPFVPGPVRHDIDLEVAARRITRLQSRRGGGW